MTNWKHWIYSMLCFHTGQWNILGKLCSSCPAQGYAPQNGNGNGKSDPKRQKTFIRTAPMFQKYPHFRSEVVFVLQSLSGDQFFAIPWTIARQAPLSMGFSMQVYWNRCHFFLQGVRIEPRSPALTGRFFTFFTTEPPGKPLRPKEKILKYCFTVYIFVYSRVFFDLPGN